MASHSLLYHNSRMRPIYFIPAALAAAVTPEACPYQRPHLVGAALTPLATADAARFARGIRTHPRPPPGRDASPTRPPADASLPTPSHRKRPFFGIIAKPLANRILCNIICLFFKRLVISNTIIEKSTLPSDIEFICHPFLDFRDNFGK